MLCSGSCYVLDHVMFWIMLCSGSCHVLDHVMFWIMLCSGSCYILVLLDHVMFWIVCYILDHVMFWTMLVWSCSFIWDELNLYSLKYQIMFQTWTAWMASRSRWLRWPTQCVRLTRKRIQWEVGRRKISTNGERRTIWNTWKTGM